MSHKVAAGALALALAVGACGLGDKQAQADRIIDEGKRLLRADAVAATLSLRVRVLPVERQLVAQEPPRIAEGSVTGLTAVLKPRANAAVVADSVRFLGSAMYERIASNTVTVGNPQAAAVPSNLNAIAAALAGAPLRTAESVAPAAPTTTTTAARTLRRSVQIVREWAAFDFADIADRDDTKHGGSLGINPVALLRLSTGVLTGSIERVSATEFKANVSRDKAERDLDEDEREVLDKMFTANAVTRRVFPAVFRFGVDGRLTSFDVTLRQQLSSKDRADARFGFAFSADPAPADVEIARPARRGTVTLRSLGQLVTTVSGL